MSRYDHKIETSLEGKSGKKFIESGKGKRIL